MEYDVPIRSLVLGITGRADIVEFQLGDNNSWQPVPVEYKRGRPKKDDTDRVQLCAQTIRLEEMLHCTIETESTPQAILYVTISVVTLIYATVREYDPSVDTRRMPRYVYWKTGGGPGEGDCDAVCS